LSVSSKLWAHNRRLLYLERQNRGTYTGGTPEKICEVRRRGILFQERAREAL